MSDSKFRTREHAPGHLRIIDHLAYSPADTKWKNNAAIQPASSVVEQAVACHNGCLSRWHFRDEARFVAVMSCFLQNGSWSYDSWLIIRLYDPPVSRIACARHSTYRAHLGDCGPPLHGSNDATSPSRAHKTRQGSSPSQLTARTSSPPP